MSERRVPLVSGMQVTATVRLVSALGAGGMGAVWLAEHTGLKTNVVVKFMLEELDDSDTARSRFSREAAAAAQVKSPHVVQMLDHGVTDDGIPFIVMEHLEGKNLATVLRERGALPPRDVVAVVVQVARALSRVHAAGLLHRDIKPDNVFLCDGDDEVFVKLLDFGIAKLHGGTVEPTLDTDTKTGQVIGTPFYMSPEQVTAQKDIDERSDLWALGVVGYECMTGKKPYEGASFGALAVKIATGTPTPPSQENPALPPSVDAWFARACAREPAERYASARELAEGLRVAFEGVVALPAGASLSDSGSRGQTSTSPMPVAPSTREREGSSLALASTVIDEPAHFEPSALSRSEPGVRAQLDAKSSSPRRTVPRSALVVAAVAAIVGASFVVVSTPRNDESTTVDAGASTAASASAPPRSHPRPPQPPRGEPASSARDTKAGDARAPDGDAGVNDLDSGALADAATAPSSKPGPSSAPSMNGSSSNGADAGAAAGSAHTGTPHPPAAPSGAPSASPSASAHPAPPHDDPLF